MAIQIYFEHKKTVRQIEFVNTFHQCWKDVNVKHVYMGAEIIHYMTKLVHKNKTKYYFLHG